MILIRGISTISDKNRASKLFVQHEPHLTLKPGHDIEVRNVENIVTIQTLLLVDRGWRGDPLGRTDEFFLLQIALDVTLRTRFLEGQIRDQRLDASERRLPCAI